MSKTPPALQFLSDPGPAGLERLADLGRILAAGLGHGWRATAAALKQDGDKVGTTLNSAVGSIGALDDGNPNDAEPAGCIPAGEWRSIPKETSGLSRDGIKQISK